MLITLTLRNRFKSSNCVFLYIRPEVFSEINFQFFLSGFAGETFHQSPGIAAGSQAHYVETGESRKTLIQNQRLLSGTFGNILIFLKIFTASISWQCTCVLALSRGSLVSITNQLNTTTQ